MLLLQVAYAFILHHKSLHPSICQYYLVSPASSLGPQEPSYSSATHSSWLSLNTSQLPTYTQGLLPQKLAASLSHLLPSASQTSPVHSAILNLLQRPFSNVLLCIFTGVFNMI